MLQRSKSRMKMETAGDSGGQAVPLDCVSGVPVGGWRREAWGRHRLFPAGLYVIESPDPRREMPPPFPL